VRTAEAEPEIDLALVSAQLAAADAKSEAATAKQQPGDFSAHGYEH
jgi:hypothetical protein